MSGDNQRRRDTLHSIVRSLESGRLSSMAEPARAGTVARLAAVTVMQHEVLITLVEALVRSGAVPPDNPEIRAAADDLGNAAKLIARTVQDLAGATDETAR